ncbi:hypothetical protein I6B53_01360 [Schaalia sp. 19OD2882]|nr:hypothetical protein I6B53_01360 [Schaalia sp. 19OD2882]
MARSVLRHCGFELAGPPLVKDGKSNLDGLIPGLARMGPHRPWVVFRDADSACPVELRALLIADRPHDGSFELRIARSMTEAWLMADHMSFARRFKIRAGSIAAEPDELPHAKRTLLALVADSTSRSVKEDMVRKDGANGPLYASRINDFAEHHWDVARACERSPSLDRTVRRLTEMCHRIRAKTAEPPR